MNVASFEYIVREAYSVRGEEGGWQVIKTFLCEGEPVFQEEASKCGDSHFYGRWPWAHHVHKPPE